MALHGVICIRLNSKSVGYGLPHIHLLLLLTNKIQPDQIDSVITAEIPNKEQDQELYDIVVKHMVHGSCGAFNHNSPCMIEGRCSKKFPKQFQSNTSSGDDGYPKYRRLSPEEGGKTCTIQNHEIDNRWNVPYNKLLLKIFGGHINVELCSSVKSIKYVTKYINKGSDQATFSVQSTYEVEQYQSGRYICSSEAVWRILSFSIHERAPTIIHLAVHVENGQKVYFSESNVSDVVDNPRDTTLTAFFKLCAEDEFAKTLTYDKFSSYYTWNQVGKKFNRRKQGTVVQGHPGVKKTDALGRVYTIHPNNTGCFHLRMLLHIVKGPTSFQNLRTVQNVIYDTFQGACKALGLLDDESHWENTLSEVSICCTPKALRYLFAIMLTFCQMTDPLMLWQNYCESMADDILHRKRQELSSNDISFDQSIFDEALFELNKEVEVLSGKSIVHFGFSLPININRTTINIECLRERNYDPHQLLLSIQNENQLNHEQRIVYDSMMSSINNNEGKILFLDAPGGHG